MKKNIKDLLKDLKMLLLNFCFLMVYIICKILVLLKNHLNYLEDNLFECFFKEALWFFILKKKKNWKMKNWRFEEENIIKNVGNLFRLKKETKGIKDKILRNIKNLFEKYHKPVSANNFWSNNYIEFKSNGNRFKTVSVEEYLDKVRLYLKDIINDLKKPGTWRIQLTIIINFISSEDDNDEDSVMH